MSDILTGLRGHWPCQDDEANNTVVNTQGGNAGLSGTPSDTDQVTTDGPGGTLLRRALGFNGTDHRVNVFGTTTNSVRALNTVTVAMFFRLASAPTATNRLWWEPTDVGATFQRFGLGILSDGSLAFRGRGNDADSFTTWATVASIDVDKIYHVAARYDAPNETASIYLDGVLAASGIIDNKTFTDTAPSSSPHFGGRNNGGVTEQPFHGDIADVRLYERVLAPADIAALYGLKRTGMKAFFLRQQMS